MTTAIHISTSGGLISAAFIENIRELGSRQRGIEPESFALPSSPAPKSPAAPEETIATAWELLLERWDAVRADLPLMDVSQVRSRWLLPLFELLDFHPVYLRGDTVLDEEGHLRFPLSHRGWQGEGAPVLHTVAPSQDLDARMGSGRGIKAKSPHDMLQAFLNASRTDQWAILSNGILLRLLRKYHHTFTKGYVQFDLESIFETRNYGDFRALYRMCHASRFVAPQTSEVSETSEVLPPLEQFYKDSLATGIKVGEDLREQVRRAIETLGNGFLAGGVLRLPIGRPDAGASELDGDLIHRLQQDEALCRHYYGEILHIIYRVLFLLFAEQRGMLPCAGASLEDLYRSQYSITALRACAEGDIPREDDFTDLWEGLRVTFRMVREGAPDLGVFGYDGMLFEDDAVVQGLAPAQGRPQGSPLQGRTCRNSDLLRAIRALTLIEREGVLQRISYADLGVEELGAIYESLLDFTPRVTTTAENANGRQIPPNTFFLDPRGTERKTTGSYYTHPSLVNELIKSALLPVMRDRLARAGLPVVDEDAVGKATAGLLTDYAGLSDEQRAAGEEALLNIKVCDPAAGSGHFLVKANNALGAELARIRTGDEYPTEDQVQAAKRDVLAHCIYAVDVNPMAVELCKVSLWINASVRDKPLSFLDHHIKCGNSLIGAAPELMADGVPTDAFKAVTGDHRPTVNAVRRQNREERKQEEAGAIQDTLWRVTVIETLEDLEHWRQITTLAEEQPKVARERYDAYQRSIEYRRKKLEAGFWTAAFFWPLDDVGAQGPASVPTHGAFRRLQAEGRRALPQEMLGQVEALAKQYRFFHWHLEFPDVFQTFEVSETSKVSSGFDVVLGNPPWERIKLQEKEFFAARDPEIANAPTAAVRRKLIQKLPDTNPALAAEYAAALRQSECESKFIRNSGRFPLTGVGDVNTYAVFAGLARQILAPTGRAGLVIPLGIATDYTYRDFFADVIESGSLVSFYDFENRAGIFPGVHRNYNFALTTLIGSAQPQPETEFAFFMTQFDDLQDDERCFTLNKYDLALINPNTRTCPIFNTRRDAELTRKIYRACPVLHNDQTDEKPWGVSFLRMFDMTNDSHLFRTREQLEAEGFMLRGSSFIRNDEIYLPLYESKMMHQFDHRHGTFADQPQRDLDQGHCRQLTDEERQDAQCWALPRHWIGSAHVVEQFGKTVAQRGWLIGLRKITRAVDLRTGTFTILPWAACSYSMNAIIPEKVTASVPALLGNLNSMTCDYALRQKLGGINLAQFIVKQLPVLPPDRYRPELLDFIVPRVVELTYTAWDIKAFADDVWREAVHGSRGAEEQGGGGADLPAAIVRQWEANVAETGGHVGAQPPDWLQVPGTSGGFPHPPFKWDEERRARLRAELDALYAHLYGLTREELAYILDTFPIVRRKDEEKWGEYRTKRLVLEAFESLRL